MTPWLDDGDVRLYAGDCRDVMAGLAQGLMDAVVCDPPYGLEFMGREWDRLKAAQEWHTTWATQALRVLKPGGHLLAFGAPRTYHRLACAVEDAGFEVRDCLCWLYGSGFPKSLDVSKAVDKAAGAECGDAGKWQGWGTALKPAYEPIILARKPLVGTVAGNVRAHGTGAINIDASRVEHDGRGVWGNHGQRPENHATEPGSNGTTMGAGWNRPGSHRHEAGRWPANVVLDEDAAALLDEQGGERPSAGVYKNPDEPKEVGARGADWTKHIFQAASNKLRDNTYAGETGGASRFFYTAKASRSERGGDNTHPTVKPVALMRWLVRLVTPCGGLILDPFLGSGTTAVAARLEGFHCVGIEQDEDYLAIAAARLGQQSLFANVEAS